MPRHVWRPFSHHSPPAKHVAAGSRTVAFTALRDQGVIQTIGRGLYRRADANITVDLDLLEIGYRALRATLCLTSALARHDLTDLIPASIDIALL